MVEDNVGGEFFWKGGRRGEVPGNDVEASFCSRVSDWADVRTCCTRSTSPHLATIVCDHFDPHGVHDVGGAEGQGQVKIDRSQRG